MTDPAKPEIATERTRLSIPFVDNQRAIRAAGKLNSGANALEFDKNEKVWYARPGANLTRLQEWIYDPAKAALPQPALDPRDEFANFLESKGAILDGLPVMDGKKHYVDIEGHDTGSRKGVYTGYLDGRPAGWFRNYKSDQELERWTSTGETTADPVALAQMRAESASKREQRQKETTEGFNTRASELMEEFRTLPAASGNEEYLVSKGVGADAGIKSDAHGNVVIPLINADGEFRTLERIWPDGNKVLATGGQAWGSFYVVGGQLRDGEDILYAEGYSTAKSISEATNKPVVMTVNAGNMVEVAGHMQERFPNSTHYFLADNDVYKEVNAGLNKATEAAELTNGHVIVPAFPQPSEGLTDFNDLHSTEGLAAVKWQVESAIQQLNKVESMPSTQPDSISTDEVSAVKNIGEAVYSRAMRLADDSVASYTPKRFDADVKALEKDFIAQVNTGTFSEKDIEFTQSVFNVVKEGRDPETLQYDWRGKLDIPTLTELHTAHAELEHRLLQARIQSEMQRDVPVSLAPYMSNRPKEAATNSVTDLTQTITVVPMVASEPTVQAMEAQTLPVSNFPAQNAQGGTSENVKSVVVTQTNQTQPEQAASPVVTPAPDVPVITPEPVMPVEASTRVKAENDTVAEPASLKDEQYSSKSVAESPVLAVNEQSDVAVTIKEQPPENAIQSVPEQQPAPDYSDYYAHYASQEDVRDEQSPDMYVTSGLQQPETPPAATATDQVSEETEKTRTAADIPVEMTVADKGKIKKDHEQEAEQHNGFTWAPDDNVTTPPKERIDLDALMKQITYRSEKDHVAYMLEGKDAFYDYGSQLRMANTEAGSDDAMVLAALQTAMAQHKRGIEITGSEEFKERVLGLMADYKIDAKLSDPHQRARYQELQKQLETVDTTQAAKAAAPTGTPSAKQGENHQDTQTASAVSQNGLNMDSENSPTRPKNEAPAEKGWLSGVIVAHGPDNFEHDKKNAMNYFVKVQNERGEKTVWGKDLERAVNDAGVKTGRLVNLRTVGEKDVQVNVPVRDENDKVIRWEKADVKRMEWEVKAAYPQKSQANPEALKPSDLVAYDAVTFNQVRDKIQAMKIDLSHERLPKQDVYWFQPNGKPADAEMQKPKDYKLAENSKHLGTPLLASPAGKNSSPEYILFESKKGFMQGVVRDHESGKYHSVIGKMNTKYKDGERKDYLTLSAVNANSANGMVWHGYGNANGKGNGIVYQNVMNKENVQHHLQPVSDDVKNKSEMKRILHAGNSAKQSDDERGTQHHAPSAKSAPKP